VTLTAIVTPVVPGAGTPTGTVTFKDGNVVLGTARVGPGGKATLTTRFATAGGHVITAVYSGSQTFVGSSKAITEQVKAPPRKTATALLAPAHPVLVGETAAFTATVRGPAGAGTPTGTITFYVDNVAVATEKLDATGKAKWVGSFSVAGQFTIRTVYSGDDNFTTSSHTLTQQVNWW
jgi:hypothetical protein